MDSINITPSLSSIEFNNIVFTYVYELLKLKPENESGAGSYYASRANNGSGIMLNDYDFKIPQVISGMDIKNVYYVGCGFNFLGFILSLMGINTVSIESDYTRFLGLEFIREKLINIFPEIQNKSTIINDVFPSKKLVYEKNSLLLFANFAARIDDEVENIILEKFNLFNYIILNKRNFNGTRDLIDDQIRLINSINSKINCNILELGENFILISNEYD